MIDFILPLHLKGPSTSCTHPNGISEDVLEPVQVLFPYHMDSIEKGFVYLGYFLKPNNYLRLDWLGLSRKFEKRINNWVLIWLSLGVGWCWLNIINQIFMFTGFS